MSNNPRIAVVSPGIPTYSETFIQAHIDKLSEKTYHIYGRPKLGYHPVFINGKPIWSSNFLVNIIEVSLDRIFNESGIGFFMRKIKFRKKLVENKIDLVLIEYGPTATYVFNDLVKLNIPFIVHFHGRDAYHYRTIKRFGDKYQKLFEFSERIIVVSVDMKEQLIQLGAPAKKIVVTQCGPNVDFQASNIPGNCPPTFISTGRFTHKKAPDILIKAFSLAIKENNQIRLVMVADGPLLNSCKKLAYDLGIDKNISFVGPKGRLEIISFFRTVRGFVQHSIRAEDGDSEGTPVSILEAMLSRLPVISTRHAGIKDVVIEGKTGFLSDEGDHVQMSKYIIKLSNNPELSNELGIQGQKRVLQEFSMEKHINCLSRTIETVLVTKNKPY